MQKPKKLFNNTDNIRSEIMEGLVYAGRGRIHALPEYCAVYRTMTQTGQTVIVSGGGMRRLPGSSVKVASMPARWVKFSPRLLPIRLSKPAGPFIRATAFCSSMGITPATA
jgi:hypothetical protein